MSIKQAELNWMQTHSGRKFYYTTDTGHTVEVPYWLMCIIDTHQTQERERKANLSWFQRLIEKI